MRGSTLPFSPPPGSQMENENDYNLIKYKNFLRKFYDTINIKPILYIYNYNYIDIYIYIESSTVSSSSSSA